MRRATLLVVALVGCGNTDWYYVAHVYTTANGLVGEVCRLPVDRWDHPPCHFEPVGPAPATPVGPAPVKAIAPAAPPPAAP